MILVIKNGICRTDIIDILKYINDSIKIDIIQSNTLTDEICNDIMLRYKIIIILGGHQSLIHRNEVDYPYGYLNKLIEFTKIWMENNICILGICLGAQIIGEALGYNTKSLGYTISGYQNKIKINNTDDILKNNLSSILSYIVTNHNDYVDIDNKNIKIIASLETGNNKYIPYIFRYKYTYGVQFHPEITLDTLKIINETYSIFNNNTISYAQNNTDKIKYTSYMFFKNWLDIIYH